MTLNLVDYIDIDEPRKMRVPDSIQRIFLDVASKNTKQKLETCGILCGVLEHNEFSVTHLLVPPQTATSDSCTMTDEMPIFDYQQQHSLLTLGWIHTHPTQTCFMSSVDLHTHCSYQYEKLI